jgi:hypothetical protein
MIRMVLKYVKLMCTSYDKSRDNSVGTALGFLLDGVLGFDSRLGYKVLSYHRVQNGSEAHPASCPPGTRGLSLAVKRTKREADY